MSFCPPENKKMLILLVFPQLFNFLFLQIRVFPLYAGDIFSAFLAVAAMIRIAPLTALACAYVVQARLNSISCHVFFLLKLFMQI